MFAFGESTRLASTYHAGSSWGCWHYCYIWLWILLSIIAYILHDFVLLLWLTDNITCYVIYLNRLFNNLMLKVLDVDLWRNLFFLDLIRNLFQRSELSVKRNFTWNGVKNFLWVLVQERNLITKIKLDPWEVGCWRITEFFVSKSSELFLLLISWLYLVWVWHAWQLWRLEIARSLRTMAEGFQHWLTILEHRVCRLNFV